MRHLRRVMLRLLLLRMLLPFRLPEFLHFQCCDSRPTAPNNFLLPEIPRHFFAGKFSCFDTSKAVRSQLCANMRPAALCFLLASLPRQTVNPLILQDRCYALSPARRDVHVRIRCLRVSFAHTAAHTRWCIPFSGNRDHETTLSSAFPSSYHWSKECLAALMSIPGRTVPTIARNTCPEVWSLRRLKRSLNKMQGLSEARLNMKSDVASALMGCKLFCATQ